MLLLEASKLATRTANKTLVEHITAIIASYRISSLGDRYEDGMKPKILDAVGRFVAKQEPVNMVVPAYPFKSPNRESKVLGPDPDLGESMTLQHFNSIGARIQQIYPPGGHVTIVSDGPCYNDLLGISDEEVFDYAKGLHRIARSLGLKHLRFTNIFELADRESSPFTTEEYTSRIGKLKEHLFASFLPPGYDFNEEIKMSNNALLTYRGYMKFLETDMAVFFREKSMGKSAAKKHVSKVARCMIERGKAFSGLVASKCPLHVRLSIHASDNTGKLSVALLPHERYSSFPVTPWHNTPYLDVTSVSLSLGRKPTGGDVNYKVCTDQLGLKFLCADVPMYSVIDTDEAMNQQVKLQPLYPFGLRIQMPKNTFITPFVLQNVTELAKLHSPIIFKGLDFTRYFSKKSDFRHSFDDDILSSILHMKIVNNAMLDRKAASYVAWTLIQQVVSVVNEGQAVQRQHKQSYFAEHSRLLLQKMNDD